MDRDRKKREEVVASYFLEKCTDAPEGKLVGAESPDFLLKVSRKQAIGIELTEIPAGDGDASFTAITHRVGEAVRKKESKLALYRKRRLDHYWLVITTDSLNGMDAGKLEDHLSRQGFEAGFSRIFLFDLFTGKIIGVK